MGLFHRGGVLGAVLLAMGGPPGGAAGSTDEVNALRREIEILRRDYDARIAALNERMARAETAERATGESLRLPASAPGGPARAFNPAVSMILQGRAARFSSGARDRGIPGFLLGGEAGVGPEGLSLGESELDLSANVDDLFYGFFDAALVQDGETTEVEIEEAYLQTLALPAGLRVKAGQFFSGIGYHNARHAHTWDFVDAPLAYEAMLGGQYLDPGVQLVWIAPTELFVELGVEVFSGDRFPAEGAGHHGYGTRAAFARFGGDVGDSHSWLAGASYLHASPRERESLDDLPLLFSGDSDLVSGHLVWKWAPHGNYRERNLVLQTEVLYRSEDGSLRLEDPVTPALGTVRGHQTGFYAQAVFQPFPRWRIGARYDELHSDNRVRGLPVATPLEGDDFTPRRVSAMIDYSHSEFSRLRLQLNRDRAGGSSENEIFLQYIMSIGSHGAHQF